MKPGVLLVISVLFTLAFVTRAVGTVAEITDRSSGAPREQKTDAIADGPEPMDEFYGMVPGADDNDADFKSLASMIMSRTEEIERRIAELDEREALLAAVEIRVDEKLKLLEEVQSSLSQTAERVDAASSQDIQALADMYANMKPQQAGAIFNAMEPSFAAGFLTAMRAETAAAILAGMEPQKAYAVSIIIAGRNVNN
ncbi:MAG: hypothetical protein AAF668_00155 [Pseudomonadota bacterium]